MERCGAAECSLGIQPTMQDTVLRPSRPRARFGLSRKLLFGRPSSWLIDLLLHDECRISRAVVLVGKTADCCPCMTCLSVSVCIRKERTFPRLSRPPPAEVVNNIWFRYGLMLFHLTPLQDETRSSLQPDPFDIQYARL